MSEKNVVLVSGDEPPTGKIMKVIELGGGSNPKFHPNVDVRADKNVDIVADFEKPLPLPDSEYDFVYSAFVLEHISWRNVPQFVKEICRILKQGGRCVVVTADLLEQCRIVANSVNLELPEPQKTFYGNFSCMIFGGQDYNENAHKSGLSQMGAAMLFRESGFSVVRVAPLPTCSSDMVIEAFK